MVAGRKRFRAGLPGRLTPAAHKAPAPMTADAGARIPTTRHPLADHRPSRAGSHADQAVWHDPAPRDQPRPAYRPLALRPGATKAQCRPSPAKGGTDARADDRCGQLAVVLNDSPPRRITRSGRPAIHTPSHPRQRRSGGYRVLHDRGAVTVGNEAPVWTSPTKPKSRMTTRSRHRLITGLLVNLTLHYGKLFSAGWTSMRHWAWLSSAGQPSSGKSANEEAGNRFRDEPPERGPAGRRRWPRARSSCRTRCMAGPLAERSPSAGISAARRSALDVSGVSSGFRPHPAYQTLAAVSRLTGNAGS